MLLCSCFCLSLESSFPLLRMSKFYLYFKMQLKCHFFHKFFPDTLHTQGRGNPDKLRPSITKESCFIHLCVYSYYRCVWHTIGVQWTQTELDFFSPQIRRTPCLITLIYLSPSPPTPPPHIEYLLYCVSPIKL